METPCLNPEAIVEALLERALDLGFPPEQLVIGATDTKAQATPKGSVFYETHVGRLEDRDTANLLDMVVKDLRDESQRQVMVILDREKKCPACGSVRFGVHQAGEKKTLRVFTFDECMDCGNTEGETPSKYKPRAKRS